MSAPPKHGNKHQKTHLGKPTKLIVDRPNRLLYGLLKCPPNAHHFTHTLHAATQQPTDAVELFQVPARDLDDHIIQAGLKARTSDFGHGVLDLVERDAESEFRSDEGERVSGCFGSEGG
jgi:hypothetical protein